MCTVYSCKFIFVFVFLNSKWKADKHGVRCIRLGPKGKTLLSAGRSIKLWDLETKETLKVQNYSAYKLSDIEIQQKKNTLPSPRLVLFSDVGKHRLLEKFTR